MRRIKLSRWCICRITRAPASSSLRHVDGLFVRASSSSNSKKASSRCSLSRLPLKSATRQQGAGGDGISCKAAQQDAAAGLWHEDSAGLCSLCPQQLARQAQQVLGQHHSCQLEPPLPMDAYHGHLPLNSSLTAWACPGRLRTRCAVWDACPGQPTYDAIFAGCVERLAVQGRHAQAGL